MNRTTGRSAAKTKPWTNRGESGVVRQTSASIIVQFGPNDNDDHRRWDMPYQLHYAYVDTGENLQSQDEVSIVNPKGDGSWKAKTLRQSWNTTKQGTKQRKLRAYPNIIHCSGTLLRYGIGPTPVHKFSSLRYRCRIPVRSLSPSGSVVAHPLLGFLTN